MKPMTLGTVCAKEEGMCFSADYPEIGSWDELDDEFTIAYGAWYFRPLRGILFKCWSRALFDNAKSGAK